MLSFSKRLAIILLLGGKLAAALTDATSPLSESISSGSISPRDISDGATLACQALQATGLGPRLLFPSTPAYDAHLTTWWSKSSRLHPNCLVLPQTTQEVSTILTILLHARACNTSSPDWHLALRSGGHMTIPGANNIANGITIDLSHLNATSYTRRSNTAHIQPGARWRDVYAALLASDNVTVAGGRDGDVGVGGFLLGGGLSFFSGRMGFGCDSVVGYEVVLGNGTIVYARNHESLSSCGSLPLSPSRYPSSESLSSGHAELWRALKGGNSNFGIVTRFDMVAVPARDLFYEVRILEVCYGDAVVDAVVRFADQGREFGGEHLIAFLSHDVSVAEDVHATVIYVNTEGEDGTEMGTAFERVRELSVLAKRTVRQSMAAAAAGSQLEGGDYSAGYALTLNNDAALLRGCLALHTNLIATLKTFLAPDQFRTVMFFQPLPSYMADISKARGGNMLGLDRVQHNAILWSAGISVNDADQETYERARIETEKLMQQVKALSRSMEGDVEFVYLNYADGSQDPLGGYGDENVAFMKRVAGLYDPTGVFQTWVPGGFKLSRVV